MNDVIETAFNRGSRFLGWIPIDVELARVELVPIGHLNSLRPMVRCVMWGGLGYKVSNEQVCSPYRNVTPRHHNDRVFALRFQHYTDFELCDYHARLRVHEQIFLTLTRLNGFF